MQSVVKYALPASFTPERQEETFGEILALYDLADEVLANVAKENAVNRDAQLELVRPFITQVNNSANILSAFYTEVVRGNRPITPELQDTFQQAFRNIFVAIKEFADEAETKLAGGKESS